MLDSSMGFINVNMTCGNFLPKNNYFASNQIAPYSSLFYMMSFLETCVDGRDRDKVVDFHWDSSDPWTVVSVSEDAETPGGGGTLQV